MEILKLETVASLNFADPGGRVETGFTARCLVSLLKSTENEEQCPKALPPMINKRSLPLTYPAGHAIMKDFLFVCCVG